MRHHGATDAKCCGAAGGVLRPADAEARHGRSIAGLAQVAAATGAIRAAEARGAGNAGVPLIELIGERARIAGLTVEDMGASGDGRLTLRVAAVKPAILLRWIAGLETGDGIIVDRVNIARNDDSSVAVELALRRSSR
jgi:type II secretory pathway component PulM